MSITFESDLTSKWLICGQTVFAFVGPVDSNYNANACRSYVVALTALRRVGNVTKVKYDDDADDDDDDNYVFSIPSSIERRLAEAAGIPHKGGGV